MSYLRIKRFFERDESRPRDGGAVDLYHFACIAFILVHLFVRVLTDVIGKRSFGRGENAHDGDRSPW